MDFLHKRVWADAGAVIVVGLGSQANVKVMDDSNFSSYRRGGRHSFYGHLAKHSPARVPVPHAGHWNVVVDLGGHAGRVSVSGIQVVG